MSAHCLASGWRSAATTSLPKGPKVRSAPRFASPPAPSYTYFISRGTRSRNLQLEPKRNHRPAERALRAGSLVHRDRVRSQQSLFAPRTEEDASLREEIVP